MRLFRARWFSVALAAALLAGPPSSAIAQAVTPQAQTLTLGGTVIDDQQRPVGGAEVRLTGPAVKTTTTAANGTFSVAELPSGIFRIEVSKAGFVSATQEDVALVAGTATDLHFTLQPASLSSLRVIGSTSVTARGRSVINTTPAAIVDVPATTFAQQGQLAVTRVLNQQPGIIINPSSNNGGTGFLANASSPLATGIPQIRGALPYETASLIDGHPISIGQFGTFNPIFINPYMLQNVEIVKGPGATPTNINYAIGGTVNFRTLEPTRDRRESFDLSTDQFGGKSANVRATGTLPGNRWSYAFDYATQGTQGYARGFTTDFAPIFFFGPTTINGTPICLNPASGACTFSFLSPGNPKFLSPPNLGANLVMCCVPEPMDSYQRNELGKIRYAFSSSTALTVTYLGAQQRGSEIGGTLYSLPGTTFTPPAGYVGPLPTGVPILFDIASFAGGLAEHNANLFQTEFRTALGATTTLLARQYTATVQSFVGGPGDRGPTPGTVTLNGNFYGGVNLNNDATPTIFNGTSGTLVSQLAYSASRSRDRLNGYTVELDQQAGDNLLSLSFDSVRTSTFVENEASFPFLAGVPVPDGSAQSFRTIMLRGQFALSPTLHATLSNYMVGYTDHYTQDGGLTFLDSTHNYDAPRLSLAWRPSTNLAVRASAGLSIAPPYVNLLTNTNTITASQTLPPSYYTTTATSGDVRPETSFGFDLGFDTRLRSFTTLSFDAFRTTLRDQFLTTTSVNGTYTPPAGDPNAGVTAPLFVTRTANLGHSRYDGLELSFRRDPPFGIGFQLAGSLVHAYAYNLPPGFYDTAAGPNTANLGVLPNANFQGSGFLFNGLSYSRVPYSTGYAEFNNRARNGAYFLLGVTYYGPNNGYNEPAFGVVNTSFSQPLTKRSSLQLSIDNVTSAYNGYYYNFFGGIPAPLQNGLLGLTPANVIGPSTARLTYHLDL